MLARSRTLAMTALAVALLSTMTGPPVNAVILGAEQSDPRPLVMVIVFENHGYTQIIGNSHAPYFNRVAHRYALATRYHAVAHPSLPDYLAMTAGKTFGIKTNCTSCSIAAVNIADQLQAAGFRWKAYAESMPSRCYARPWSGRYAKKHLPFLYYKSISSKRDRCRTHVVPLSHLWSNVRHHRIPDFSFVVPNLCHDMHDCSVSTGDSWLRTFLKRVLAVHAFARRGVVVITFDEDFGTLRNRVATLVVNERGQRSRLLGRQYDHYSLLLSVEDVFGLTHLGKAAGRDRRPLPLGPLPSPQPT
jgi:phospholipase C